MDNTYKVAAASSDGIVVNQHFGRADTFYIYEIDKTGKYQFFESRKVTPICHGGEHDRFELKDTIGKLKDCKYILVSRIGFGAVREVEQSGMIPMELPGMIVDAIDRVRTYRQIQNLLERK